MKKFFFFALLALIFIGCDNKKGIFINTVQSKYSTEEGVKKFENILDEKGLSIFQVIDHAQNAKNSNMELLPNTLVVFGNPKMGSVLIECNHSMGLDLPLKMLFYTDYEGNSWISYTNPEYYSLKHNIKDKNCLAVITKASIALQTLADELADNNTSTQEVNETIQNSDMNQSQTKEAK